MAPHRRTDSSLATATGTALNVSGVSVSDAGLTSTNANVQLQLGAAHGTVNVSTSVTGGISTSQVASNASGSVTITAPLAAINATLAASGGLAYTPNSGFVGSDTLGLSLSDLGNRTLGTAQTATQSIPLSVVGPLAIGVPSGTKSLGANASLAITGISLTDPSIPTADNITLTLVATPGVVSLSTAVTNGLTSAQVTGNGSTSVTITAPLAAINATLANANGLTYTPNSGYSGSDSLTLSGNDQIGNTNSATITISVAGPEFSITAPTSTQSLKTDSSLVVSNIALADPSLPTTSNVTLTFGATSGVVSLSTAVTNGLTSSQVTSNGTTSVTVTAPLAAINATLADANGLTYTPNSGFTGDDTLALSANDPLGNSTTSSVAIAVAGPLSITAPISTQSVKINTNLVMSNITIADPSLPTTTNVTLTLSATSGVVSLSTAVTNGLTSSQVTSNGTTSVTITAPLAAINATLADANGLTYTPSSGFTGGDTLALSATDPLGDTRGKQRHDHRGRTIVDYRADQHANGSEQQQPGRGQLCTCRSVAADNLERHADLRRTSGVVSLSTAVTNGLTSSQVTGNGTTSVTVTAPLAAINATLADANGLTYTPNTGFTGGDTLALSANDPLGNSATSSVTISVAAPLSITAPTSTQSVATNSSLVVGNVAVADPSLPTTTNVTLTFGATSGVVSLSTAVTNGLTSSQVTGNGTTSVTVTAPLAAINATLADANGLTYTPNTGFTGGDTLALSANDPLGNSVPAASRSPWPDRCRSPRRSRRNR